MGVGRLSRSIADHQWLIAGGFALSGCSLWRDQPPTAPVTWTHPEMIQVESRGKTMRQGTDGAGAGPGESPAMEAVFAHDFWMDRLEVTQWYFRNLMGRDPAPGLVRG